jgi:hypothetical protein
MVDFTSSQARAKEVAPSASHEGDQNEATRAMTLSTSPSLPADGVDKMYHQLVEIDAITAAQLAECAQWRRFDPSPSLVRARTGLQRPVMKPSVVRLAPSPPY